MQIREVYLTGSHTPLDCPEDSVFFPPINIDNAIVVPVLIGDSNNTKYYMIRCVDKYMTIMEESVSIQALGHLDLFGNLGYIYVLEKENA